MEKDSFKISVLCPEDAVGLYELILSNKKRLKRYFPVTLSSNATLGKTIEYISIKNKEIAERTNFTFAIRNIKTQQIVGLIILKKINWETKQGEFAYCIGLELEGKGLTSLAVKEMSKFTFEDLGLKTIQIIAHKTNIGSCKVAEKNGFIWQRTLPNEFTPIDEIPLDMELYELYNEK